MKIEVRAQFSLFGVLSRDGNLHIAYCPPLDITTQGRTQSEAKRNLIEASELFLISCLERGTLDQALKELGFFVVKTGSPYTQVKGNPFKINIPIPFGLGKSVACPV